MKRYKKLYKDLDNCIRHFETHITLEIKRLSREIDTLKQKILELNLQNKLEEARKLQFMCDHKEYKQNVFWEVLAKLAQCIFDFGVRNG